MEQADFERLRDRFLEVFMGSGHALAAEVVAACPDFGSFLPLLHHPLPGRTGEELRIVPTEDGGFKVHEITRYEDGGAMVTLAVVHPHRTPRDD